MPPSLPLLALFFSFSFHRKGAAGGSDAGRCEAPGKVSAGKRRSASTDATWEGGKEGGRRPREAERRKGGKGLREAPAPASRPAEHGNGRRTAHPGPAAARVRCPLPPSPGPARSLAHSLTCGELSAGRSRQSGRASGQQQGERRQQRQRGRGAGPPAHADLPRSFPKRPGLPRPAAAGGARLAQPSRPGKPRAQGRPPAGAAVCGATGAAPRQHRLLSSSGVTLLPGERGGREEPSERPTPAPRHLAQGMWDSGPRPRRGRSGARQRLLLQAWGQRRLGSARHGTARLSTARLSEALPGSARLGTAWLCESPSSSARLSSAPLGTALLGTALRVPRAGTASGKGRSWRGGGTGAGAAGVGGPGRYLQRESPAEPCVLRSVLLVLKPRCGSGCERCALAVPRAGCVFETGLFFSLPPLWQHSSSSWCRRSLTDRN